MADGGLRKIFPVYLPGHFQAIETGGTGLGVPDHNCCDGGFEYWVEYKLTSTNTVGIRPEQVGWIERRLRNGGRVFIAVRYKAPKGPRRGAAVDELRLYHGSVVRYLETGGMTHAPELGRWAGGPAKWNWQEVHKLLIS